MRLRLVEVSGMDQAIAKDSAHGLRERRLRVQGLGFKVYRAWGFGLRLCGLEAARERATNSSEADAPTITQSLPG